MLAVGLVDDIRGLSAWKKLGWPSHCRSLDALSGTHFGHLLSYELPPFLDVILAVVWIVAVINAYNLIDGLDGLASGLAIVSATGLCGVLILGNLHGVILPLIALIGACLAFLRYNFQPATIFLGDTGSMSIGLFLGVISLQTFTKNTFFLSMSIPLLVLGVPIYDALLAIWRRAVRRIVLGDSPDGVAKPGGIMMADLEHLHHRLSKAGLSASPRGGGSLRHQRVARSLWPAAHGLSIPRSRHFPPCLVGGRLCVVAPNGGDRVARDGARALDRFAPSELFPVQGSDLSSVGCCLPGGRAGGGQWLFEPARVGFWRSWFLDLPIWVTPAFCLLAMSRTYVTVWTRARILDVLMLLFTLQAGLILSLGIALLVDPSSPTRWYLRTLVILALGHAAIILPRVFYRCLEEIVLYLRSTSDVNAKSERLVLYGAGGRCQLFLKERGFNNSSSFDNRAIVGLIDDEPALHFKWVYGHLVLGALRDLPQLIPHHRITGIIITARLVPESSAAVRELASRHGLLLSEWRFETRRLEAVSDEALARAGTAAVH